MIAAVAQYQVDLVDLNQEAVLLEQFVPKNLKQTRPIFLVQSSERIKRFVIALKEILERKNGLESLIQKIEMGDKISQYLI